MNLADQVESIVRLAVAEAPKSQQSDGIAHATKLFNDLAARGLLDAPTYRLAPFNAVPPKSAALTKFHAR